MKTSLKDVSCVYILTATILTSLSILSFLILSSSSTSASDHVSNVSVTVPVSCNIASTLNTAHTATINPGQYKENIGTTTFKVFCNDNTGYAIYAIGYSNEEYGNTNLLPTNTSNSAIATGLATSGNTSNWAMKLAPVTAESSGTVQPYVLTIENGYENYSLVPEEYTKVATFTSTTDFTIGSNLTSTYRAYIQGMQPADTYQGKVKYTLVHPNDANPPKISTAYLDTGENIYLKITNLTPYVHVQAFKRSNTLPNDFTPSESNTISLASSDMPVYIYYDNSTNTLYYYSEAIKIMMNEDSSYMFNDFEYLSDISGLSQWNLSDVKYMYGMFRINYALTDLSPIANWNTSRVTGMADMFMEIPVTNIDALSGWDISSVVSMSEMFYGADNLTDVSGAANWDTSSLKDIHYMFYGASIDGRVLNNWNTSNLISMGNAFAGANHLPSWCDDTCNP